MVRFKTFHKLLGLVTYLDWIMIFITTLTTISQMFETPEYRVVQKKKIFRQSLMVDGACQG